MTREDKIKLPNFLIVGAAKAGTTSLSYYLKQHPEIYISPVKEPKFFTAQFLNFPLKGIGDDLVEKHIIKTFDRYKKLFKWATPQRKAIGEASVDNLYYHKGAILQIKKYLGNPKIIIILRNPVSRAFSAYTHLVRDGREYLSFEEGLLMEEKRMAENWEFMWYYKDVGLYYEQVKDYLDNFSDVKIYLTEDLEQKTLEVVKDIFRFLEVDENFTPDTSVKYNVSGIPKKKIYAKISRHLNTLGSFLERSVNYIFPKKGIKVVGFFEKIRAKEFEKPKMLESTRKSLIEFYKADILKTQDLIGRDLSNWLR
ncbi:MAG: sulfotransferase [Mesoaciditoga sp.]|uniref:sulfotransferase family protein n=1 Tax=Athalassotoga sp. TaxID=2022597 RepID=UPI000CC0B253|nr:MAG: sulfotransferase [Mesoaciditoga sp.]HEU24894.1 sulfotransferase [Mesoaciditoga lauensis]